MNAETGLDPATPDLTAAERAQLRVSVRLLQTGRWLVLPSLALLWLPGLAGWRLLPALLLLASSLYCLVRTELDAGLLDDLARQHLTPAELSQALIALGLKSAEHQPSLSQACRGSLRWFRWLAVSVGLYWLWCLFSICN